MRVTNLSGAAIGIRSTATVEVVGHHIAIFIDTIATFRDVIITGAAIFVGTIEFAIAIVIEPIRAGARTEFRLSWLTRVTRGTIAKRQTIRIGTIDIPITIVVFEVIANFHRIGFDQHIEGKRTFIGAKFRINRVSIEEDVIRPRIKERELDFRRPLNTAAVVIARNLFTRITLTSADVQDRIERRSDRIEDHTRRVGEHEVENGFSGITATSPLRFAHIARRIADVRTRAWDQFRRQAIGLLNDTNGIIRAIDVLTIRRSVVVVIDPIVTDFGLGHAIGRKETRRIGTIDLVVAIVVNPVITNLG
jgi:hypothetical protein